MSCILSMALAACASAPPMESWATCRGGCVEGARLQRLQQAAGRLAWAGLKAEKMHVLNTPGVGAYSWQRGDIYVTAGLLDVATDDEVVAALAHEMGHLVHDRQLPVPAGLVGRVPGGHDVEVAADAVAVVLLRRNGISPEVLAGLLAKVAARDASFKSEMVRRVAAIRLAEAAKETP